MYYKKGLKPGPIIGLITLVVVISAAILQLTGKIDLLMDQRDFCPGIGDDVLCGICNKDIKLSDNPHAGQCRMCPAGTACSGDVCGEITCLPSGTLPENRTRFDIKNITYTSKEGDVLVAQSAYVGYVQVFTRNVSQQVAETGFAKFNGTVYAAAPRAGLYILHVTAGSESLFLSSLYAYPWVEDALPLSPPKDSFVTVIDHFSQASAFTRQFDCAADHGNIVELQIKRLEAKTERVAMPPRGQEGPGWPVQYFDEHVNRIRKADKTCDHVIFSLSLQTEDSGKAQSMDRTGCTTTECKQIRKSQLAFFRWQIGIFDELLINGEIDAADRALMVISAGNAGVDLDSELAHLQADSPKNYKHMIIVGSLDYANTSRIVTWHNHLANSTLRPKQTQPLMIYALGENVSIQNNAGKVIATCSGTSFAAPEVSAMMEYLWSRAPTLSATQLTEVFYATLLQADKQARIPQLLEPPILATDPQFLARALTLAQKAEETTDLNGFWEGTYAAHGEISGLSTCITDTLVPVSACIHADCHQINGTFSFPKGVTGVITSPDAGAVCPEVPLLCASPTLSCNGFSGRREDDRIFMDTFTLHGGSYIPSEMIGADDADSWSTLEDNTTTFYFSTSGQSGRYSRSSFEGNISLHKVVGKICK